MIGKIQAETFNYITSLIEEYGIRSDFDYSPDLDILNGVRKSIKLRIENKNVFDEVVKGYTEGNSKFNHNLGLFSRSPIRKTQIMGNNMDLEYFCRTYSDEYGIELRNAFFGEVSFSVKMIFDSHEVSDLMETIYLYHLANKEKSFKTTYKLGDNVEPLEDVTYTLKFSGINDIGAVNSSNLRYLDFDIELFGLFFMPFYQDGQLLEKIDLEVHVIDHEEDINPNTASEETLVHDKTYRMNRN